MKLLEKYALETGLKIGQQFLLEKFFPLPFDKYITIQTGSGQAAKNYPHYKEVINLVKNKLNESNIGVVVLGGKDDQQLPECHNLNGQTNIHQTNYILARSLLHISNDSWTAHRAGYLKIPLIALYGSTTIKNHSPYSYNEEKTVFLESHRNNKNPSYQVQENPQTISFITPEDIANNIFKLLGIDLLFGHKSLYFGPFYYENMIELVPNCILHPSVQLTTPLVIRMDYEFNEMFLQQNLQIRKCLVVTNKEINLNILGTFKTNIFTIRIEINENFDLKWIKSIVRSGISHSFFTLETDSQKLSDLRMKFFDICTIENITFPNFDSFKDGVKIYTNKENIDLSNLDFLTNKFIVSNDKIYLSKAHLDVDQSVTSFEKRRGEVIYNETFWKELNHFYIYE